MMENVITLAETTSFIVDNRGKTAPTEDDGIPLIATNCIDNKDLYPTYKNVRYVSKDTYDNWFRSHPLPGDIIITLKGSQNGAVCLVPDPVDFVIAQDMVALRVNKEIIDPHYLLAVLRSREVQHQIKTLDVSGVIPHLKKSDFDKLILPYPDKDTQKYIGKLYFKLSDKIHLLRQQNETLEQIAQTLFKRWFVDFEFPNEDEQPYKSSGGKMVDSELGEIPEGWRASSLGELAENNASTFKFSDEEVVFVNTGDILEGNFLHKNYSSPIRLPGQAKKAIDLYDILYSEIRPKNKRVAFVDFDAKDYVVSTKFMVIKTKGEIYPQILYLILKRDNSVKEINHIAESRSGTFPQVTFDSISDFPIIHGAKEIQDRFMDILKPIMERQSLIKAEIETLTKLRDTLLPKLMSGEIRVKLFIENFYSLSQLKNIAKENEISEVDLFIKIANEHAIIIDKDDDGLSPKDDSIEFAIEDLKSYEEILKTGVSEEFALLYLEKVGVEEYNRAFDDAYEAIAKKDQQQADDVLRKYCQGLGKDVHFARHFIYLFHEGEGLLHPIETADYYSKKYNELINKGIPPSKAHKEADEYAYKNTYRW